MHSGSYLHSLVIRYDDILLLNLVAMVMFTLIDLLICLLITSTYLNLVIICWYHTRAEHWTLRNPKSNLEPLWVNIIEHILISISNTSIRSVINPTVYSWLSTAVEISMTASELELLALNPYWWSIPLSKLCMFLMKLSSLGTHCFS